MCLSPRASVLLSVPVGVCSAAEGLSVVSVTACLSVCRRLSLECVWAPGSLGLGSERGRGRGGGSPGRRGGAGAETVGGGGRGRRAARRGCVRGAGGGGCQSRLSLRWGTSAASSSRRGPARPPQVSLPPRPGPSSGPRPIPHPGNGARPEGPRLPNRTPTAPRGLPSDAPRRPTLTLNSSLTAAYLTIARAGDSIPQGQLPPLLSNSCGDPRAPLPLLAPKSGATGRCPLLGGGIQAAQVPGARLGPPGSRDPSAPAQLPAEAPSQAQASPSRGDSVSILGEGEA